MSTHKRPWRVLLAATVLTLAWSAAAPAAGISGSDQTPLPPSKTESAKLPKAVHPQVKRAKRAPSFARTQRAPVRVASEANVSRLCGEFRLCRYYLPLFLGVAY
jgi:hypothetical protein